MKTVSTIRDYFAPLDLRKAQAYLREKYGNDAPSYPTLRRWVEAGQLKSAERPDAGGSRVLYSLPEVERLFLSSPMGAKLAIDEAVIGEPAKPRLNAVLEDTPAVGAGVSVDTSGMNGRLDMLIESVAALVARSDQQQTMLAKIFSALDEMQAVRRALMIKYDSLNGSQLDMIENLRAQVKGQDKQLDFVQAAGKVSVQISQLKDLVNNFMDSIQTVVDNAQIKPSSQG